MLKTALAIRHIGFEDLGYFEAPLIRAGYRLHEVDAGTAATWPVDPRAADLLILLGGPMGVYEEDRHPFLAEERAIVADRVAAGRPVLGICLGAQLIAAALGARVYPGPVKEIGFAPVSLTEAGAHSPLAAIAAEQPVLHWHGDTFDLPEGATRLASTPAYANQAFAVGTSVLALQFHLEAGDGIERWLRGHAAELSAAAIDVEELRNGAARHGDALKDVADRTLTTWLANIAK